MKFGTSGLRGLVSELSDDVCFSYTISFLKSLEGNHPRKLVVANDLRPSSPRIALACINAAISLDYEVVYGGSVPTPALAFYADVNTIPAIMITGSHIPFDRNGLKFYTVNGEITKDEELKITQYYVEKKCVMHTDLPIINNDVHSSYIDRYIKFFSSDALSGFRIGVYQHSSVARDILIEIFEKLGATAVSLGRTDYFVPVDTEAVSREDADRAAKWSTDVGFDFLVSTDGDGDRPMVSDENGIWFRGDMLGILTAMFLDAKVVVTPVSTTSLLEKSQLFPEIRRTKIGSPYVIEAISKSQSSNTVGFEANGGFLLGTTLQTENQELKKLLTRDAVLPMLCVMLLAKRQNVKASELTKGLRYIYTASDRIQEFPVQKSVDLIEGLVRNNDFIREFIPSNLKSIVEINVVDGYRVHFDCGAIVHLRPSGNAPELRCYTEYDTLQKAKDLNSFVIQQLKKIV